MTEGDHHLLHETTEGSEGRYYKVAAIALSICGAMYGTVSHEAGTTIFSLASSVMLIFGIVPPSELAPSGLPRFMGILSRSLRRIFYRGDRVVRIMMIILAVGGSAVICKYGITGFSLLPKYADVVVKRFGAFLVFAAPVIYAASLVSKRIYKLSDKENDLSIRRYELMFYIAVVFFVVTLFISFALFQIETAGLRSDASPDSPLFPKDTPTVLPGLGLDQVKYIWWVCLIWLVWIISLGSCLISRFLERRWQG